MSDITIIGANHQTAPVELREKLAFSLDQVKDALGWMKQETWIREGLLFSTCNRTEFVIVPVTTEPNVRQKVLEFISHRKSLDVSEFDNSMYLYQKDQAVRHLFCVAASLDSMVVGEPQILGQIKQAYKEALGVKACGVLLNRLMHKGFSIAKRVRNETGIGDHAVSVSYAATQLAGKIFADLSTKTVMLLGAGEMAELAVSHLVSHGVHKILVANRTFKNALTLSKKFQAQAVQFDEINSAVKDADIIISSTGASEYLIKAEQVRQIMKQRGNKTLFFIDIAVPRDIDPAINQIPNAYVYDIDDLKKVVQTNIKQREKEVVRANAIVEEGVVSFQKWCEDLAIVPTIKALNEKMTRIVDMECEKTLGRLSHLPDHDVEAIRRMTQAIASRAIHDPIQFLRDTGDHRDDSLYLSVARQLFNLED